MNTLRVSVAMGVMLLCIPSIRAAEIWEPGELLAQAFTQLTSQIDALDQQVRYGVEPASLSLMGANLALNEDVGFRRSFRQGTRYAFVAGASKAADDIQIEIYDAEENLVGRDRTIGPQSGMLFQPRQSGVYTVRLRLREAQSNCVALLAILSDGGDSLSGDALNQSFQHVLGSCQAIATRTRCQFADSEKQWMIWGALLPPRRLVEVSNVRLGTGMKSILAAGHDPQSNIDLSLERDGETLQTDSEPDHKPIVFQQATDNELYSVQMINRASSRPVFVLSVALDVELPSEN